MGLQMAGWPIMTELQSHCALTRGLGACKATWTSWRQALCADTAEV